MRNNLLSWQWHGYADNHVVRANLALHLVTVPLFDAGLIATVSWLVAAIAAAASGHAQPTLGWLVAGIASMLVALAAQGRGHRGEPVAPVPFTGPGDFVSRFFVEQLVTFPRFVLSGGWLAAWRGRAAGAPRA